MTGLTIPLIRKKLSKLKSFQGTAENILFPLILFFWPFTGIGRGMDLADTTYALGNYRYIATLDPMWKFSTFIPNITGKLLSMLPGGTSMSVIDIYATLFICAAALVTYVLLRRWFPGWMIFTGVFMAESLFWCPSVILYNTLSSLLLTCGTLTLARAMTDYKQKPLIYILAGIFFGLNVCVRLPNVVQAVMIVILPFYAHMHKWDRKDTVKRVLFCVLGWCIGFLVPLLFIFCVYGPKVYGIMLGDLSGVSANAGDYSFAGQILAIISSYLHTAKSMLLVLPCIAAAAILLMLEQGRFYWAKRIICTAGFALLFFHYYRTGVFTGNYRYLDSVFEIAQMLVICSVILFILTIAGCLRGGGSERALSLASLIIILTSPLGSNNSTYPVMENLFIVLPVTLWLIRRYRQVFGLRSSLLPREVHFSWKSFLGVLLLAVLFQGVLFHLEYRFGDGYDGSPRDTRISSVTSDAGPASRNLIHTAGNILTSEDTAAELSDIASFLDGNKISDRSLLQFGQAPGFNYLFGMAPVRHTTWPSLDSYSKDKFEGMLGIAGEKGLPVVITDKAFVAGLYRDDPGTEQAADKYIMLLGFMDSNGYKQVYETVRYSIYSPY